MGNDDFDLGNVMYYPGVWMPVGREIYIECGEGVFMIPQLDHFIGKRFEGVEEYGNSENWEWAMRFEGGVLVQNCDEDRTEPPTDAVGLALLTVTLGELDTEMHFGSLNPDQSVNWGPVVTLTPTKYAISLPGASEPVYPQRVDDVEDGLPDDPSEARVVEDAPE